MSSAKEPNNLSDDQILRMLEAARDARLRAYASYSKYQVGAAVLDENGHIFGGCNVENASYGLCMCAERVAIFGAIAAGAVKPQAIAVVTQDAAAPCGACRQVLVEFNPQMAVIIAGLHDETCRTTTAAELLPDYFELKN